MPTFSSVEAIKKYILDRSKVAVEAAQEQVYQIIDNFLKAFYADYDPSLYHRTYQLLVSLVKTNVRSTGNGWEAEVYFDYSSLAYMTGAQPSGLQVMVAAAHGGHGAAGLKVVPGSVSVWDDPMMVLNAEAIGILKKELIAAGIPVV